MARHCTVCGKRAYSDFCMQHKPRKRIRQMGKEADKWTEFRDTIARPYLDEIDGHNCNCCGRGGKLDVDHIIEKGGHAELKYELSNLQYLCRSCHIEKTAKRECIHEEN